MGIAERRQREKEMRREAIIEAAAKTFMEKGLSGSTMEEIASRAELSKATLYLYFTNKEELFLAVLLIVTEVFNSEMASGQKEENDEFQNLDALGKSYLAFYKKHPAYYKLLNTMEPSDDFNFSKYKLSGELAVANAKIWDTVCGPIIKGMKRGIFKPDTNPLEVGMTLWMAGTGIINLMDHVQNSPHHDLPCDMPENSTMMQIGRMNFEKMLDDLWCAVVSYITIKTNNEEKGK